VPVFAGLASIAVLSIPAKAIDYNRARDLDGEHDAAATTPKPADYSILFKSRPLVVFGLCVMLFHLANAALLPLVGQKLAAAYLTRRQNAHQSGRPPATLDFMGSRPKYYGRKSDARKLRFALRFQSDLGRPVPSRKNISLVPSGKSVVLLGASHPLRGGSRSSRTRDGMRWTRQRRARQR
jgi:hypothetical protein